MHPTQPLAVALLGDRDRSAHLAAIAQTPDVRLTGMTASSVAVNLSGSAEAVDSPQELVNPERWDVLVICTDANERAYWIEAGLRSGQRVISPLAESLHTEGETHRLWVDVPLCWSEVEEQLRRGVQVAGPASYVRASLHVPPDWLQDEVLLPRWGAGLPFLLQKVLGPIDFIQARTRSRRLPGPREDHVVALLNFLDGTEGHMEVDAFAESGHWRIEVICERDAFVCSGDLPLDRSRGLAAMYQSVTQEPIMGEREAREALFLCRWIRQSARQDTALTRREARR